MMRDSEAQCGRTISNTTVACSPGSPLDANYYRFGFSFSPDLNSGLLVPAFNFFVRDPNTKLLQSFTPTQNGRPSLAVNAGVETCNEMVSEVS